MSDFKGFRFGNIHIKDLHLTVVSSGDRFNKNLLPDPTDYSVDVPGGNGKYYFGQTHGTRNYPVKTAFDNLDEATIRRIRQIFVTDKLKDLVFDEEPYKTYRAKLSRAPSFNYVCFLDKETNQRVYKGECDFDFILYHPYAFCFNKYIVTAADYYRCTPPELIIKPSEDTYAINNNPVPPVNKTIKNHYNIINNMQTPWKGGYPTIEQVQNGELFFNDPEDGGTKSIINVRNYWDNIPRWQVAAKLLTSPTLDYDQGLIYMPQYSNSKYYNMDMGMNVKNSAIGSRLLVYNPGDIPIDFKLNLGNLSNEFRGETDYIFRISRYNVQRLTIEQAIDWTGLKTFKIEDNDKYKYDNKYFVISNTNQPLRNLEDLFPNQEFFPIEYNKDIQRLNNMGTDMYKELKYSHPHYCYIAEPIPKDKLSYFIRLFYKQTNLIFDKDIYNDNKKASQDNHFLNHIQGEIYAKEYEDKLEMCITEDESNELYWTTLRKAILDRYNDYNEIIEDKIFDENYTYEDFVYDFIYNPSEYIRKTEDLNYGEFNFNLSRLPQFYTYDYLDISNENFDKIIWKNCGCEKEEISNKKAIKTLTLDSESRLLYNIKEEYWDSNSEVLEKNFFKIDKDKISFNDNIKQGHWFQLPPGWSLIDISPIVKEDQWGGKRWMDARPFNWGTISIEERNNYNQIYFEAIKLFIEKFYPERKPENWPEDLESLIEFRLWYNDFEEKSLPESYAKELLEQKKYKEFLSYSINRNKTEICEIKFLRFLNDCFNYFGIDIDQWWWNSNNYMWINYPPLYWNFVDLLNRASIEYIPQYY